MTASKTKSSRSTDQPSAEAAANRAASIQRQLDRQELHCCLIALAAKAALILVGCVSVARMSVAYQERLDRHGEIAAVVNLEAKRLETLQNRFDRLFSIGGEKRLLSEQDQWIAPNRLRVIWR
ncbi:hypothetical protein [Synechococcus sp. A15-28]|uniref:hypothetical protein n=1 Tax=Synechococcus sp. A15-28 TaxID=1050638 RepID=UPI0016493D8C|nr:hypothetical protein [Synechococcus sp. A15-28]QNI42911.1 conserved membrane protein [Synechococcus sp. A15-28]